MSTGLKVAIAVIVLLVAGIGGYWSMSISAHNTAVQHEAGIRAQYEQNRNTLSAMSLAVMEAAQVPAMARDDLTAVITAGLEGRYGEDGSDAMLQAMTEAYPGELDMSLYRTLQNQIEAGRTNFRNEQEILIGRIQGYEVDLRGYFSGGFMRRAGFPEINLADYRPVISGHAQDAFETGIDQGLQLRGDGG